MIRNVPNATLQSPGRKFIFTSESLQKSYEDQFEPYKLPIIGCDLKEYFNGTLLRFPIRFGASKIQSTSRSVSEVKKLVDNFIKCAPNMLLFLKNVCNIKVYIWQNGAKAPTLQAHIAKNKLVDFKSQTDNCHSHILEISDVISNNNNKPKWFVCDSTKSLSNNDPQMIEILKVNTYCKISFLSFNRIVKKSYC